MLLWKAAMCSGCTAGPAKCLSHSAWPCLRWASLIDQMRRAAQREVCAPSRGTQTRKTGASLRHSSIKGQGMFFLLSGTERAAAVCCISCGSPERGGSEQNTSQASHSAAAQIHPIWYFGSLNIRQLGKLGKLRPASCPQVCLAQECSLLVTIERPKQINLGVNPL